MAITELEEEREKIIQLVGRAGVHPLRLNGSKKTAYEMVGSLYDLNINLEQRLRHQQTTLLHALQEASQLRDHVTTMQEVGNEQLEIRRQLQEQIRHLSSVREGDVSWI